MVKEHSKKQEAKYEEALLMNRLYFEVGLSKLMEKEIQGLTEEVVGNLPEKTRDIFSMSRKWYQTNSEIAKKLNVTEKTVEYHIAKALSILRRELKDYLAD